MGNIYLKSRQYQWVYRYQSSKYWENLSNLKQMKHSKNRIFIEKIEEISRQCVLLFRPLHMRDLEKGNLLDHALYIYSQWEGYWDQKSYASLREWLEKHHIPRISIHTSGHASPSDLKRFSAALKPAKIVPIHTFMPDKYPELFNNVHLHADGEYWEV